jgi:hypothetical protein
MGGAGGNHPLRHEVARNEWACRRGLDDARDVATGLCSTCPRRDVRGRFLTGRVRSSRESLRAAAPAMAATGEGKDRRDDCQETLADASSFPHPGLGRAAGVAGAGR